MAFTRTARKSVDDTQAKGGKGDRRPGIRDLVQTVEWPKNAKFLTVRLFPGVVPVGIHDYPLYRKDGTQVINEKSKKQSTVAKVCLKFNPDTQERESDNECPYCDAEMLFKIEYWAEGNIREEESALPAKNKPSKEEAKTGYKSLDNDGSATPVRCFRFTGGVFKKIKALKQLNKVKQGSDKVPFPVDDEEHGCELNMNFDNSAAGGDMYGIQKGDQAPITEEENAYLRWDIEGAIVKATEELEEAERNVAWFKKHSGAETGSGDSGEDYDPEVGDMVKLVLEEDDEVVTGKCLESTTKFILIEDSEGDERKVRWADVSKTERAPDKKAKPAAKGKKQVEDDEPVNKAKGKKVEEPEDDQSDADEYIPEEGDYVQVFDADDEELVQGNVTSVDAKSITVEDAEHDKHTHRMAKVTVSKIVKPKAVAKKKPVPADDDDEEQEKPAKSKKKPAPEPEEEEDEDEYTPAKGDMVVIKDSDDEELVTGKVIKVDSKSITVEDEEGEETVHRLAKVMVEKVKPKVKAVKGKAKAHVTNEDDSDEDDDEPVAKRKPEGKRKFDFDED